MADELEQSPKGWTESQVSDWLRLIGVKKQYVEKLYEEEVDGHILLALNEEFLKTKIEDHDTDDEKETKYEIVHSAVEHLEKGYWTKKKDIPQRKRRIYTHFFLGSGNGLDKFVHKRKFERVTKGFSVSEKRMKWFRGEAWKTPEIAAMLKCVSGWTEDGVVYLEGPRKKKFNIQPLHVPSVPHSNENITFYLGFTFRGPVACNIIVKQ
ncbi:hypothetical protein VZT92_007462 [Zoarces viviparus]|uniref:SAM domain-containing protein n=1 Tax=Zoarces viviparus TaxID=48416 RepID=A0AAW1FK09_ZOAVI